MAAMSLTPSDRFTSCMIILSLPPSDASFESGTVEHVSAYQYFMDYRLVYSTPLMGASSGFSVGSATTSSSDGGGGRAMVSLGAIDWVFFSCTFAVSDSTKLLLAVLDVWEQRGGRTRRGLIDQKGRQLKQPNKRLRGGLKSHNRCTMYNEKHILVDTASILRYRRFRRDSDTGDGPRRGCLK